MWLVMTTVVFLAAQWVYKKRKKNYLLPVFTTTIALISVIVLSGQSYEQYYASAKWIDWLLGPAVVALSYPLYKYRTMLLKSGVKIIGWVTVASLLSVVTGALVLSLFPVSHNYIVTAMLKNITTPVAIDLAEIYGGIPSLVAIICTLCGMLGAVVGPMIYRRFNVQSKLAQGVAMGALAHAIGTSRLMEEDDYSGAISTLSFLVVTLVMPLFVPVLVYWLS
ncbi:LrgB family protein [Allobacillus sp. GCM10007491]|uniref:LrgB family protein n=1 Tax=Allobacillus saliphilus TaxID=2912308 RepID=A0A941CSU3_9BACI|nr:LrgB family protein [Allobacillus saliphilus]